jgi:hypothetical protein
MNTVPDTVEESLKHHKNIPRRTELFCMREDEKEYAEVAIMEATLTDAYQMLGKTIHWLDGNPYTVMAVEWGNLHAVLGDYNGYRKLWSPIITEGHFGYASSIHDKIEWDDED